MAYSLAWQCWDLLSLLNGFLESIQQIPGLGGKKAR